MKTTTSSRGYGVSREPKIKWWQFIKLFKKHFLEFKVELVVEFDFDQIDLMPLPSFESKVSYPKPEERRCYESKS